MVDNRIHDSELTSENPIVVMGDTGHTVAIGDGFDNMDSLTRQLNHAMKTGNATKDINLENATKISVFDSVEIYTLSGSVGTK